jgi:hypothetical protein
MPKSKSKRDPPGPPVPRKRRTVKPKKREDSPPPRYEEPNPFCPDEERKPKRQEQSVTREGISNPGD